jgi:hypothetical protein
MDFFTMLNLASVAPGTYSQLSLTLSSPQITVLDVNNKFAPLALPTNLTASTVTINLDPPLVVTANGTAALNVDFKLRKSVQTDAAGQVTGTVNPVLTARPQMTPVNHEFGEDEGLEGLVQSVSTTASGSFVGSFVVTTESGNTPTVEVTSSTEFDDVAGLSALTPKSFVKVDAFVDENGNIVARRVEVEEQEEQQRAAFAGLITSAQRDNTGNVTQFTMFVRWEAPDESACVPRHSNLTVNVDSGTQFKIFASELNEAGGLAFNASALGPGQRVVVHGACPAATAGPTPSITATSIFLRRQTVLGNASPPPLAVGSDGKTGGFTLIPCGVVFMGHPITVFTFAETNFEGVTDLNGLTAPPPLAVKGLLLYVVQPITVNTINVTAPPPVPVFEARQVHQLDLE